MLVESAWVEEGIIEISLNDPDSRNAMSEAMAGAFARCVSEVRREERARVVFLSGRGDAFSGGGHLEMLFERTKLSEERNRELMLEFYSRFLSITEIPVPTIALLNGHAIGAGLCLALACDLRLASVEAKFGLNFVRIGLHPGMGATYFLPRIVGAARARELLYTGRIFSAAEAERIQLVHEVVPKEQLRERALDIARSIVRSGPQAVRSLKESLRKNENATLSDCLACEAEAQARDYGGTEFLEGIRAAREKREARFP